MHEWDHDPDIPDQAKKALAEMPADIAEAFYRVGKMDIEHRKRVEGGACRRCGAFPATHRGLCGRCFWSIWGPDPS